MKFLGWMHRKLRENSIDPLKDLTIGNSCTCFSTKTFHDEQESFVKPNLGLAYGSKSIDQQLKEEYEASFTQEPHTEIPVLFPGFLTIGTLGISEPGTPTFAVSLDDIAEKVTEVTEDELKLINDELEKFLEVESDEEGFNGTSRNSCVSTITFCSKQMEVPQGEEQGNTPICPLQGYLFGSSVELQETRTEKKTKKTSLAQLFQETKQADGDGTPCVEQYEIGEVKARITAKQTHKASKRLMKKILKKLCASKTPHDSTLREASNSVLAKKRFQKVGDSVLQMFYRKIHPENSRNQNEGSKSQGYKSSNFLSENRYKNDGTVGSDGSENFTQGAQSKESINSLKYRYSKPVCNSSDESIGHWIRTDADYLVLEL